MSLIKAMWFKALYRRRRTEPVITQKPVEWSQLRIDRNDGSHVLEYRIADGWVEHRAIKNASENEATEAPWERITPAGLRSLVTTKSIVAVWLSHRLGIDALRRACGQSCESDKESDAGRLRRAQAITQ